MARRFVRLSTFIPIFVSVTSALLPVVQPESPRVLTSLSTNPRNLAITVKAATGIFHLLINSYHNYALCLQTISVFLFVHNITHAIRHLSAPAQNSLNHFEVFTSNYRAVAVLMANYAAIYRHWTLTMELMCLVVMVLNIYQAVIFGHYRAFVLVFAIGMGLSWIIKEEAKVYDASREVLDSWEQKMHTLPKEGRMFLKSCRPVSIPLGSIFLWTGESF